MHRDSMALEKNQNPRKRQNGNSDLRSGAEGHLENEPWDTVATSEYFWARGVAFGSRDMCVGVLDVHSLTGDHRHRHVCHFQTLPLSLLFLAPLFS
jgi:hypothetical protein